MSKMEFERLVIIAQDTIDCDRSTAEDLVQDVYAGMAKNNPKIKDYDKYVASAVIKKAIDYLRASKRKKGREINFTDLGVGPHGEGLAI